MIYSFIYNNHSFCITAGLLLWYAKVDPGPVHQAPPPFFFLKIFNIVFVNFY